MPDELPALSSRNFTTGALGDEPLSRSTIGGTSCECSRSFSLSVMQWRLLATRRWLQLPFQRTLKARSERISRFSQTQAVSAAESPGADVIPARIALVSRYGEHCRRLLSSCVSARVEREGRRCWGGTMSKK